MKGSRVDARAYALKLLGYRSRSRKEMIERLELKGFAPEQINAAMEFLDNADLINDRSLAPELLRYCIEKKSLGKTGIRRFLHERGLDKGLIEETLSSHSRDAEERTAIEFARKKVRSLQRHPYDVKKRRLWGMLQRRGFASEVIKKAVRAVQEEVT